MHHDAGLANGRALVGPGAVEVYDEGPVAQGPSEQRRRRVEREVSVNDIGARAQGLDGTVHPQPGAPAGRRAAPVGQPGVGARTDQHLAMIEPGAIKRVDQVM